MRPNLASPSKSPFHAAGKDKAGLGFRDGNPSKELVRSLLQSEGGIAPWLSDGERRELQGLAEEVDAELFFEGLFQLGKGLEAVDKVEAAAGVYTAVVEALREGPLRESALQQLAAIQGRGAFSPRFEFLLRRFTKDACDPRMILPMLAGTATYQIVKTASLGRLAGSARVAWWSRGLGARFSAGAAGFSAEVPVFALSGRALRKLGDSQIPQPDIAQDLASAALTLGVLKLYGFAGDQFITKVHGNGFFVRNARNPIALRILPWLHTQAFLFAGMLTAHKLEERVGLRPSMDGATTLTDTLSSMISLSLGARLGRWMLGPGFQAFQRELGWRAKNFEDSGPASRGLSWARPSLVSAKGLDTPAAKLDILAMSLGGRGSSGKGDPSYALREVERWLDQPRIDLAWQIFQHWSALEGQLRPEDFSQLAAKLLPRMDAKGSLPPRLAINMMGRLLPRLPPEEAGPIFLKLEKKLHHAEAEIQEAALASLKAAALHTPPDIVDRLLPSLDRFMVADHPWFPGQAFHVSALLTKTLPEARRLPHLLALESRMAELGIGEGNELPESARALSSPERAALARTVETRLFKEESGAQGPLREALLQMFPLLSESDRAELRQGMQGRAVTPRGAEGLAALEILGEWAGHYGTEERLALIAWGSPFLHDRQLTRRMKAMDALWKLVRECPSGIRLAQAEVLDPALRDESVEMRRSAVGAWGLLRHWLTPEQSLEIAGRLIRLRDDPSLEVRQSVWREISDIAQDLDSRGALDLLRLCLREAGLENLPIEVLKVMEGIIPKRLLAEGYPPVLGDDFSRYAAYRNAELPFEPVLWKSYLRSAAPADFLARVRGELRTFRRGLEPERKVLHQVLLAYAALEVSPGLDFADFRRGLRGKRPPAPFLTDSFRALVREKASVHGLIDKGKLIQSLGFLKYVGSVSAFRNELQEFILKRHSELRSIRTAMQENFAEDWDSISQEEMVVAAKLVLPKLWEHRQIPAVRELIQRFGFFLAWERIANSPQRQRMAEGLSNKAASQALVNALRATEEFYRDTLADVFRELGINTGEIPAVRRQREALATELARLGRVSEQETEVEFIPSKSEVDRFFAFVSEDCNENRQKAIFREDFQLMRLIAGERLRGLLYLHQVRLGGRRALVLGLQPRPTWEVDHGHLLEVVERELGRIAQARGYEAVLLMADDNQQSNRHDMLEAIRSRGYRRRVLRTGVSGAVFEGKEFLVLWERAGKAKAD